MNQPLKDQQVHCPPSSSPSATHRMVSRRPWRYTVAAIESVCQVSMVTNECLVEWRTSKLCKPHFTGRLVQKIQHCLCTHQCQEGMKWTLAAHMQSNVCSSAGKPTVSREKSCFLIIFRTLRQVDFRNLLFLFPIKWELELRVPRTSTIPPFPFLY